MIDAIKDKVVAIMMKREKTASGIIIPNAVQEPQAFCKVISIGNEVTTVAEGDIIVCHIRGGMDVVIDKELVKVLKEEEIYGILTHDATLKSLQEFILEKPEEKRIVS